MPFSNGLLARQPFPTFLILDVYGFQNSFEIAYKAYLAFRDEIATTHYVHLPNVETYLREELSAAYQFLTAHPHLWEFCGPHLAGAVKGRQSAVRDGTRLRSRQAVKAVARPDPSGPTGMEDVPLEYSRTAALAWCVLVESALLTDRLQQDTWEQATAEQVSLPMAGHWLPYFLPCPPPEARVAFNDDVEYRWPVRVFALDPYTQEQNLADPNVGRPAALDVTVHFSYAGCAFDLPLGPLQGKTDATGETMTYTATPDDVKRLMRKAFDPVNRFGPFSEATDPPADPTKPRDAPYLKVTGLKIVGGDKTAPAEVARAPALKFECGICVVPPVKP